MGIVSVQQKGRPKGKFILDGFAREYEGTYQVITTDYTVTLLEVALANLGVAGRIPRWGERLSLDPGAIVVDVAPEQIDDDDPTVWEVRVTWRSFSADPDRQQESGGGSGENPENTNPLLQPPKIKWGTKYVRIGVRETIDTPSRQIVNSAGAPFKNLEIDLPLTTLTINRNEPVFNPFTMDLYKGKVSSNIWQDRTPGRWKCTDIVGEDDYRDGVFYVRVQYDFLLDKPPLYFHQLALLDAGPYYLEAVDVGPPSPRTEMTGTGGFAGDVLLDGAGGKLAANAEPVRLDFNVIDSANFDDLNLPDPAYQP